MNPNLSEIMTALLDYVRKLVEAETLEDVQQNEQLAKLESLIKENQAYAQERSTLLTQVEELRGLLTQLEQKQPNTEPTPAPEAPVSELPTTTEPLPGSEVPTPVEPPVEVTDAPASGEV